MEHNIALNELNLLSEDAKSILSAWRTYIDKVNREYDVNVYNSDYIDTLKKKAEEDFQKFCTIRFGAMYESIDKIVKAEEENESIVDINNHSLQSAINFIDALGERASFMVADSIVTTLRGDYNSLQMVKKLFQSRNIQLSEDYEKYFSKPSVRANDIKKALDSLQGNVTNVSKLISLNRSITEYANLIGVTLDNAELDVSNEEVVNTAVRSAMGL